MKENSQQPEQNQKNIIPHPAWNSALEPCTNQADNGGSRQDIERATNFSPSRLPKHRCVEGYTNDFKSIIPPRRVCVCSAVDKGMSSDFSTMHVCFDGSWRSPASSGLPSVSDVIERKLSSESIESEILPWNLDAAPSLDDVFDVLDEMGPFESDLSMNTHVPLSAPSTPFMSQLYWSDGLHQPPSGLNASHSFQPFHLDLVKSLQNPSRGLITAMRRLCELLSKPRSDHLESVFVRLLNNTLNDMEDAAQPQSKRPRRNNERLPVSKRKRPNKSTSDAERRNESAYIGLSRTRTSKSHSLPVISSKADRYTETIDLTDSEECEEQKQLDAKAIQKEPFIALEDTMSAFVESFLSTKSLSNTVTQGGERSLVVGRWHCDPEVPGSNPPPCH